MRPATRLFLLLLAEKAWWSVVTVPIARERAVARTCQLENIRFRFDPQLNIRPISSRSRENAAGTSERYFFSAANGTL